MLYCIGYVTTSYVDLFRENHYIWNSENKQGNQNACEDFHTKIFHLSVTSGYIQKSIECFLFQMKHRIKGLVCSKYLASTKYALFLG